MERQDRLHLDHAQTAIPNLQSEAVVSASLLFRLLGITPDQLQHETITVNAKALRRLLQEVALGQMFDPEFYAQTYPDLEVARLEGRLSNLHDHYIQTGFFEGRLPSEPPFDAEWYATYYSDLKGEFGTDRAALQNHFRTAGLAEARAGTEDSLPATETWQL